MTSGTPEIEQYMLVMLEEVEEVEKVEEEVEEVPEVTMVMVSYLYLTTHGGRELEPL